MPPSVLSVSLPLPGFRTLVVASTAVDARLLSIKAFHSPSCRNRTLPQRRHSFLSHARSACTFLSSRSCVLSLCSATPRGRGSNHDNNDNGCNKRFNAFAHHDPYIFTSLLSTELRGMITRKQMGSHEASKSTRADGGLNCGKMASESAKSINKWLLKCCQMNFRH